MNNSSSNRYDVIIIGAGIGGLVCGCYLAKAGKKVLIIERRANVGGCCTSFTTNGFTFDAFAHSVGGLRENGVLEIVLRELEIKNRIVIQRHDPSDIFLTPDYRICFWNDLERTKDELKSNFPGESANLDNLMDYLAFSKGGRSVQLRNMTFLAFLDEYIKDPKLKALLSLPVLGNAGLPPSRISAFTATKLFQEFHLDGGYYPDGGMQKFANLFSERFKEFGGTFLLSRMVRKLLFTNDGTIDGVELNSGERLFSQAVISNCDPKQTFHDFIELNLKKPGIHSMEPSSSAYSIFLGTDKKITEQSQDFKSTVWHMSNYDVEGMYLKARDGIFDQILWFMLFSSPDEKGFAISILAPFQNEEFWEKNRNILAQKLYDHAQKSLPIIRGLDIKHRVIITPQTINRWTLNYRGAAYGWASTPSQFVVPGLTQTTFIDGLFLTGHWTTQTVGVSGVAYMGRDTAKIVLNRCKK